MPYSFYMFWHVFSLMAAVISLGAILGHLLQGGSKQDFQPRKLIAIIHGVALAFAFISGFGLIAKGGYSFSTSQWLYIKLFGWLILGAFPLLAYRKILPPRTALITLILVVGLAVYAVSFKPF